MVGEYERPLSLTTMITGRSCAAAMLFSASQAMPPVRAPSPTTATTGRVSPRTAKALASPAGEGRGRPGGGERRGGGVAGLDPDWLALGAAGIAGQAVALSPPLARED